MKDILLNEDFDLDIADGDFVVGSSTLQHQKLLLLANPGDYKENPTVGVGIHGFLKSEESTQLYAAIKREFEKDGMVVNKIEMINDNINIDAHF